LEWEGVYMNEGCVCTFAMINCHCKSRTTYKFRYYEAAKKLDHDSCKSDQQKSKYI